MPLLVPAIKVLIVDDEPDQLKLTLLGIESNSEKYKVESASSSKEALDLIHRSSFDCIVSDYVMPDIDGLELCRRLREEGYDTPFILFTGHGSEEVAEKAFHVGVDSYLRKETNLSVYAVLTKNIKTLVDKRRSEKAVEESNRRIKRLLDSIQEIFWQLNENYRFVYVSKSLADTAHMKPEEMIGKSIWELFPKQLGTNFEQKVREVMDTREIRRFEMPGKYTDAWYTFTIYPSEDGVFAIGTDITESLRASSRLRIAKDAAKVGIFEYDVQEGTIECDERVRELWGVSCGNPMKFEVFMAGVHPDDRAIMEAAVNKAFDSSGEGELHAEIRVVNQSEDGVRLIETTGKAFFSDGKAERLIGTVHDITERMNAE